MGKNEEWLIKLAIEEGRPLPRSIVEAPLLDEITTDYYKAFGGLSRARGFTSYGVSLPLTFEAVDRFATRFGFDDDFEDFYIIISGIDDAYLNAEVKRRGAEKRRADKERKRRERKSNKKN